MTLSLFLYDSPTLWARSEYSGDELLAGTAFKSYKALKREAKEAKHLAEWDGWGDVKVTFWKLDRKEKPVQVKFDRNGKIKK